jgi:hypothetical protein
MGITQLLFWSFAAGTYFGPAPLFPIELAVGSLLSFLLAAGFSWPIVRRRLEDQARCVVRWKEGRAQRRLAFHDNYLVIDQEIVLQLEKVELEPEGLTLSYPDPEIGGRVVRTFTGPADAIARAQRESEGRLLGAGKVG